MDKRSKPHILMLLTQDLNSPSGLGRYFPLAKYLVREDFQVTILALHSNFAEVEEKIVVQEGVVIHYVAQMHVRKTGNKTHYFSPLQLLKVSWQALKKLYSEAINERPDLIFVGKPHPMNGLAALRLAKKKTIPLVVDCDDFEAESNKTQGNWQKKVLAYFEQMLPKKAGLVTTNTYFMLDRLSSNGVPKEKIQYLPNGVDRERFFEPSAEEVTRLREKLGLNGFKVVGYFGSLNLANHPVDLLVRSFAEVAESAGDIKLLIVGSGADFEKLQTLAGELGISNRVVFTGRINPDKMNLYYKLADVSVDPVNDTMADRGRCPLKLFESWQMGVPVVTSDVGDRKILAGEPSAALLCKPGDMMDLARNINKVLSNPDLLNQLSKQGADNNKKYDWASISETFIQQIEILSKD